MRNLKMMQLCKGLLWFSTMICLSLPCNSFPSYAKSSQPEITIEKPSSWQHSKVKVYIQVDGSAIRKDFKVKKMEVRIGTAGNWINITRDGAVTIEKNCTVYVRITDEKGKIYEQNRSIKCYDEEKPTLAATLSDGVLVIQGNDTISGIDSITVNGTTYKELTKGCLKLQLTQSEYKTKLIKLTATDKAGNTSLTYTLQNPYYGYESSTSGSGKENTDSELSGTTQTSASSSLTGTNEENETTALPQKDSVTANNPVSATGSVIDRTETETSKGKEFYTIKTESGKIFYLIVDNSKTEDNVYFLTEVNNKDLLNFTQGNTLTLPDENVLSVLEGEEESKEETESSILETEPEVEMPEEDSSFGNYFFIFLLVLIGGGAGIGLFYYWKKYQSQKDEEEESEWEEDTKSEEILDEEEEEEE